MNELATKFWLEYWQDSTPPTNVRAYRFGESEEDPMAGTANLVDAMLVIAVGLLVFCVFPRTSESLPLAHLIEIASRLAFGSGDTRAAWNNELL